MKTIWLIVWANITSKKFQSIALSVVFIAVSILFFLSIRLFGTSLEYEKIYEESKTSQSLIYVTGEDLKDTIVSYLNDSEEIVNVSVLANFDDIIETKVKSGENSTPITDAFLTEFATGEYDQLKIIEGKSASQLLENEVIFSYGKSKINNIKINDKILVNTINGLTEMTVKGIGVDLTYNFDTISLNRFWTTKGTIDNLEFGEKNYSIGISYNEYSPQSEEMMMDEIVELLGESSSEMLILPFQLVLQANSFFQIIMGAIFTLIGVILIVVGLFIVRSIIYNNIVTDYKKIATLKSTGFSSKNIISIYLLEYGLIAFISIILGIFGSVIIANIILSDIIELSKMFGIATSLGIIKLIVVFIIILIIIEITVYTVSRRVSKINPAVALSRGIKSYETKAFMPLMKHQKMPLSLSLAIKDILYNKKMILTLIIFIIATSFTIITLSTASTSLNMQKDQVDLWLGYDIDAKVVSSSPLDLETHLEILSKLELSDYVSGTVTVYNDLTSQIYDDKNQKYITAISQVFITDNKEIIDFNVLDGRLPENENEIMLGHNLLIELDKEIWDYVTVRSLGEEKELLVVGEFQSLTNQGITFRIFLDEIKDEFINNSLIQVNFIDQVEEDVLEEEIESIFGTDITLVFEYANASLVSMLEVLSVVTTGVISIFAVISLIVLLNLNITNINQQRFNYGIYKSIGMDDKTIIYIYIFKNVIINIIGVAIGGVIGILSAPSIMNKMTGSLGIVEFPTEIDYSSILLSFAIVFGVTLLNAVVIKQNISTITPKDLLVE